MSMTSWASRASANAGPLSEDSHVSRVPCNMAVSGPGAGRAVKLHELLIAHWQRDVEYDGVTSHVG